MTTAQTKRLLLELKSEFPDVLYRMVGDELGLIVPRTWPADQDSQLRKFLKRVSWEEPVLEDDSNLHYEAKTSKASKA